MKHKGHIYKVLIPFIALIFWLLPCEVAAQTGTNWTSSDPSVQHECGDYQWPLVQSPCPEVQIKQKHDHTPMKQYQAQGWDTAVNCSNALIELSCMPFIPVQYFNGHYTVDTIPYDPPDPTFALGTKMPVSTDDDFANDTTPIPFSFFFFGLKKTAFVLGANGLITFNKTSKGKYCPWKYSAPVPWANEMTTGAPKSIGCNVTVANMRDAIYGIYEDTHPIASYLHGDQGIYYGVQDEYPCRKIICSWNGIPTFPGSRNQDNRCTYQIVCYEGSNIIEVHVKRRGVNTAWQGGNGLLAIQNATGQPQDSLGIEGPVSAMKVRDGAPAAFYPTTANHGVNGNLLSTQLDSIAFRFTPEGNTNVSYKWYRIFDDGRDSIQLTTDASDSIGYYTPMGYMMPTCPTLTTAVVRPTEVSRYVFEMRFVDAASNRYYLRDTITIGVDTSRVITIRPTGRSADEHQMDICSAADARITIEFPGVQDTAQTFLELKRIHNGVEIPLPDSLFTLGQLYEDVETGHKRIPAILRPDEISANLQPGEIDSITIHLSIDFVSGCHNSADFLVRIFPAYDTTEHYAICRGESLTWHVNGHTYTESTTTPMMNIPTLVGCDSVVHLDLTVYDQSFTVDYKAACKPYTWINDSTYTESNNVASGVDIIVLQNIAGCDSTVQLDFTMTPMTPHIDCDHEFIDYNDLDIIVTDVSEGGDSRVWHFPTGEPQYGPTAWYRATADMDTVQIMMVESSLYGCVDTAIVILPFHHDVIWVPNAFTPDRTDGSDNMFFGSKSRHLVKEHTLVYNRGGELVFECNEIDCQWDGTDLRGEPCPTGSYIYLIRYTTEYEPHKTEVLKGSVTLIR